MTIPLWAPDPAQISVANITRFISQINDHHGLTLGDDYFSLQDWAVANPRDFWSGVWKFCEVTASRYSDSVLEEAKKFPGARWFPQARLNAAENLLRYRDDRIALVSLRENGERREMSYANLYLRVAELASSLRVRGVAPNDRVAAFIPNIEEAVVAMLATTSIGAVWSSCSPDFGIHGALDRIGQVQPKVLFSADGYYYNGKACDSLQRVSAIVDGIDSIEVTVVVPVLTKQPDLKRICNGILFEDFLDDEATAIQFEQLPFDHPLYIMYSSGTTGIPKCIVHGAGGSLLQHLKEHQLLLDLKREDVFFYFTTCGWMMWNWLISGLASGATLVLYDGSPFARNSQRLLDTIDEEKISIFGTSAKFIATLQKAGHKPCESHNLQSLNVILSTGSPLSHECFEYVYNDFKRNVRLSSISGGTDILSCFVGGCQILPVYAGEIQAPGLGMSVEIWDGEGHSVIERKGELVCTAPFPSCPIGFLNDADDSKFRAAYFERWPGIWAHGDYGEITQYGGFIIHGRSDAVLNPGGVRIGTSEIYRQLELVVEVLDSIVIGQEWKDDVRVVLFVLLREGLTLDDALCAKIRTLIRENTTPRHVPEKILQVADIPRTRSGKIVELAVRDVVNGLEVCNINALENPDALDLFRDLPMLRR
ncbi:MAG: acetoacetate--CoA ligase [Halioglobus sp.]|nr:acetoacetate--CoA ligase [Halioglobus sp.]